MLRDQSRAYYGLLGLTIAFSALALITLIPNPAASKPSVLGYRAVCSFAPASTALCALLAAVTCTVRGRVASSNARSARYRPLILPAGAAIILIAVFAVFFALFMSAQARFQAIINRTTAQAAAAQVQDARGASALVDGRRSASAAEGDVSATVELVVADGRIQQLELTGGRNVEPAVASRLFESVKAAQSTRVDAVSGATASSTVVLSAIEEALRKTP